MTKPELIAELGRRIRKIEHPDLTDEEALELEMGTGCVVEYVCNGQKAIRKMGFGNDIYTDEKILGLPITLPRVLACLGKLKMMYAAIVLTDNEVVIARAEGNPYAGGSTIRLPLHANISVNHLTWQLRIKISDSTFRDATADDQSEETLAALIELFPQEK